MALGQGMFSYYTKHIFQALFRKLEETRRLPNDEAQLRLTTTIIVMIEARWQSIMVRVL
jgi:hypothetical protein